MIASRSVPQPVPAATAPQIAPGRKAQTRAAIDLGATRALLPIARMNRQGKPTDPHAPAAPPGDRARVILVPRPLHPGPHGPRGPRAREPVEPRHRRLHLRPGLDRRLALELGRAASVPLALVSAARVPALARPGGGAGANRRPRRELLASEVFIVVTSYRIPAETSLAAFTAAIEEAARYPSPVTIVAAVVEMADQRLAKDLFRRLAPPARVRLILVRGKPTGKRDALARALRAVARTRTAAGCRGAGPGRRHRPAAGLPRPHPALLPPVPVAGGADHRRGLPRARGRVPPCAPGTGCASPSAIC